jgi:hypothetical protein
LWEAILSVKPNKQLAIKAAIRLTPQYAELLQSCQKTGGRISFQAEVSEIQNQLGAYVLMYDNEVKIGRAMFIAFFGEEQWLSLNADMKVASIEEQQAFLDEMLNLDDESIDEGLSAFEIPQTPNEWRIAREALSELPEDERKAAEKSGAYFWCFLFSSFFNTLSLMVHGSKLTSLVPLAIAGDDNAFFKAIQIDRMLLLHHPYFRDRKFRAQNEGDSGFLSKLLYREMNSPLRGKIRHPGLYMLFGILESFQWLNRLKHEEILDIFDDAEMDRYQNRIEDVNYLTKRLIEYRRWQKSGGLSMR